MPKSSSSFSSARLGAAATLHRNPYTLLAIIIAIIFLFAFAYKPRAAIRSCHFNAQESAKQRLVLRAKAEPQNPEYQQAIRSGLFIEQDYITFYRNCTRGKGYQ